MKAALPTHDTLNYHFANRIYRALDEIREELLRCPNNAVWAFEQHNPFAGTTMHLQNPSLLDCAVYKRMQTGRAAWDTWVSLVLREMEKSEASDESIQEELVDVLEEMKETVRRPRNLTPRPFARD